MTEIIVIPDYYLANTKGYSGLEGVQRLYNVDLMALVSYDQVTHNDDNKWSLGYLTIVGAYALPGTSHDTATLVDLAVVDSATRSLVIRAGGTSHGSSSLVDVRNGKANVKVVARTGALGASGGGGSVAYPGLVGLVLLATAGVAGKRKPHPLSA